MLLKKNYGASNPQAANDLKASQRMDEAAAPHEKPTFSELEELLPSIETAQETFDLRTMQTYDDAKIATATADFNRILETAVPAILQHVRAELADEYLTDWRPKTPIDTWFGPEPLTYIRHILRDRAVSRFGGAPGRQFA